MTQYDCPLLTSAGSYERKKAPVERQAKVFEARSDRIREHRHRAVPVPPKLFLHKIVNLCSLPFLKGVHLREQEGDVRRVATEISDQFNIVLGQGRVNAHRHQG